MAWTAIPQTSEWEYSTDPNTDKKADDTYDYDLDSGHVQGIRTNSDTTEIYVLCRQIIGAVPKIPGGGYGEINKTALEG